ncbi:hypothetical protein [Afipia carboxidovorans]|uniref:hypothetical protein n=1 Tax=Afipia carboxidovorans TaxID=40137 RepID=UPI0030900C6B|nr:hypothetical protein CRBSH125_09190 [Afipia carboxidovorans]
MKPRFEDIPRLPARIFLAAIMPIVVVWTIVNRIWIETRDIPSYILSDLAEDFACFRRDWRAAGRDRHG